MDQSKIKNNLQTIRISIMIVSSVIIGGLGIYYFYLKVNGELSLFSTAIIGGIMSLILCLLCVILFFDDRNKLRKNLGGAIFVMAGTGFVLVLSLFIILKHLLKG